MTHFLRLCAALAFSVVFVPAAEPLAVSNLKRNDAVHFEREILPFLKESCLACHNQTKAKADLILETPDAILKGGESGPAVAPGQPEESLLLKVASHREKPFMPPPENKVNAPQLTPDQLGLLKLWIEQGASGEVRGNAAIAWRSLAQKVRPILSLALTDDAQFAACGRGNELFIYQLPTRHSLPPLVDPQARSSSSTPTAHLDLVQALDFSPDGELLASGSYREVKLWRRQRNVAAESPLSKIPAEFKLIGATSNYVAVISTDDRLQIWNVPEAKLEHELQLNASPQAVTWMGSERIALAFPEQIQILTRQLEPVTVLTNKTAPTLAGSTNRLVWPGKGGLVMIWDISSNALAPTFTNQAAVVAVAISPDGNQMAVSGGDKVIRLVDLTDRKVIRELQGEYRANYQVTRLQRSLSRATTHAAFRKSNVEKVEKERKTQVDRVRKAGETVSAAQKAFVEQQNQLTAAKNEEAGIQKELEGIRDKLKEAGEKAVKEQAELAKAKAEIKETKLSALETKIHELVGLAGNAALSTNKLAELKVETEKNQKALEEKIKAAQKKISDAEALLKRGELTNAATENELHFAIAAAQKAADELNAAQNDFQLAEAERKQNEMQLEAAKSAFTNSLRIAQSLSFSADGTMLAATCEKSVTLWSVDTGAPLETFEMQEPAVCLYFHGNDRVVAGKTRALQTTPGWKLERTIALVSGAPAFADRVNALRFSPDGQFLASGGGEPSRSGEVLIWRVKDGQLAHGFKNLHSDAVLALAYSSDGRYLASGAADRFAKVTEIATGEVVRTLEGHTHHVLSVAWRADGHNLATGGADNLIKFWDALSGEKKKSPEAFSKEVSAITYVGETDQVLASCGDGTLRILKENGEKVRSFEGAASFLQAALASADGTLVLAGGQDGILRVWDAGSGKLISQY